MINRQSVRDTVRFPRTNSEGFSTPRSTAVKIGDGTLATRKTPRSSKREWVRSLGALSIAILVVALYASVCFHWGGPRVTLLLISLIVGVGLLCVERPW